MRERDDDPAYADDARERRNDELTTRYLHSRGGPWDVPTEDSEKENGDEAAL